MNKNCLLCGVGGQGVVLASKLLAYAAMGKGMDVCTSETIGMAQRGGSVVSHVRMGREIYSPMVPKGKADLLIAFEPGEAVRNLSYLKTPGSPKGLEGASGGREGGTVVVNQKAVQPVTASLGGNRYDGDEMLAYLKAQVKRLHIVDGEELCVKAGSPKVLNVALLGAAIGSGALDIEASEIEAEIEKHVKPQFREMNLKALRLGIDAAR